MTKFFGWSIVRRDDSQSDDNKQQFAPPTKDDGAVQLVDSGIRNTFLDIDGSIKTEAELITRYRELSLQPEINSAIDDIINECVAYDEKANLVALNLDMLPTKYNDRIRELISNEFETILKLYDFNNSAYEIIRRWYIDGRMYYYALIDKQHPEDGIQELRYIDPRQMRKVRVVKQEISKDGSQQTLVKKVQEYFLYSEKGFAAKSMSTTGYQNNKSVKISKDAIVHATSGLMDPTNTTVLSYLHKASKPLNQLRAIEDASVINRLVRAPMRRIFTVEVGSLPKAKGEQYLKDQMTLYKNKLTYDSTTGAIKDNRHFMTMLEDFWFPSRQGNQTTKVETLQGASDWHDLDDLTYFREQLLSALNVPVSRLQPGAPFNIGRASEITRDELKFAKFIARLRLRFSTVFKSALTKQLILKKILTEEECKEIMSLIAFDYKRDNFFSELKDSEILQNRVGTLNLVQPYVGVYYSQDWVKKNVLHQDEEEIKEQAEQMAKEPPPLQLDAMMGGGTQQLPQEAPQPQQNQPPAK